MACAGPEILPHTPNSMTNVISSWYMHSAVGLRSEIEWSYQIQPRTRGGGGGGGGGGMSNHMHSLGVGCVR